MAAQKRSTAPKRKGKADRKLIAEMARMGTSLAEAFATPSKKPSALPAVKTIPEDRVDFALYAIGQVEFLMAELKRIARRMDCGDDAEGMEISAVIRAIAIRAQQMANAAQSSIGEDNIELEEIQAGVLHG